MLQSGNFIIFFSYNNNMLKLNHHLNINIVLLSIFFITVIFDYF
jgi:hypothetical protein